MTNTTGKHSKQWQKYIQRMRQCLRRGGCRRGLVGFSGALPKGNSNQSYSYQTVKFWKRFWKWKFWLRLVLHTCNPSIREPDTEGYGIQGHLWQHSKFESGLGYMTPYLKIKKLSVELRSTMSKMKNSLERIKSHISTKQDRISKRNMRMERDCARRVQSIAEKKTGRSFSRLPQKAQKYKKLYRQV